MSHHPTHINYGVEDLLRRVQQCQLHGNFESTLVDVGGMSNSLGDRKSHLSWRYLLAVLIGCQPNMKRGLHPYFWDNPPSGQSLEAPLGSHTFSFCRKA